MSERLEFLLDKSRFAITDRGLPIADTTISARWASDEWVIHLKSTGFLHENQALIVIGSGYHLADAIASAERWLDRCIASSARRRAEGESGSQRWLVDHLAAAADRQAAYKVERAKEIDKVLDDIQARLAEFGDENVSDFVIRVLKSRKARATEGGA